MWALLRQHGLLTVASKPAVPTAFATDDASTATGVHDRRTCYVLADLALERCPEQADKRKRNRGGVSDLGDCLYFLSDEADIYSNRAKLLA
jgi:hypothetical protein